MPKTGRRCRAPTDCSPDGWLGTLAVVVRNGFSRHIALLDRSRLSPSSPTLAVCGPVQSGHPVGLDWTEPYVRLGSSGLAESLGRSGYLECAIFSGDMQFCGGHKGSLGPPAPASRALAKVGEPGLKIPGLARPGVGTGFGPMAFVAYGGLQPPSV
jgi:hypothetical protein